MQKQRAAKGGKEQRGEERKEIYNLHMRALCGLGKGSLPLCLTSFLFPDFRH